MHVGVPKPRASVSGACDGPALLLSVVSLTACSPATVGFMSIAIYNIKLHFSWVIMSGNRRWTCLHVVVQALAQQMRPARQMLSS